MTLCTFSVRINGGSIHEVKINSGLYKKAAIYAFANCDYEPDGNLQVAEVWVPEFVDQNHPPVFFGRDLSNNVFGVVKAPHYMQNAENNMYLKIE